MARATPSTTIDAESAVAWLRRQGSAAGRDGLARFAIPTEKAFGVPMREVQGFAKQIGRDHALAEALWKTGWLEARYLSAYIDDPALVTPAQMDRWCRQFDHWAICDTVCFVLFDRTPHAWAKVSAWAARPEEYVRRGAFALLWGLTRHDKATPNAPFLEGLRLIERASSDDRLYVKKAVNMALRAVGKRNAALRTAATDVATRLAASDEPAARWIGKDALRELTRGAASRAGRRAGTAGRAARATGRRPQH
jgi:3-methyladenine DNA glycosylase AlkD